MLEWVGAIISFPEEDPKVLEIKYLAQGCPYLD